MTFAATPALLTANARRPWGGRRPVLAIPVGFVASPWRLLAHSSENVYGFHGKSGVCRRQV